MSQVTLQGWLPAGHITLMLPPLRLGTPASARQAKLLLLSGCGRSDLLDVQACSVEEGGDSGMSKAGMHENKLPLANSRRRHFAARRRRRPRSLPLLPVCPPAPAPPINHSSMYLASTYRGAATA